MKKNLLFLTCLVLASMNAKAVNINKALLQHKGQVTLFDGNNMQDAVNASVDGDTIYLTLGTFKPFTINKKITIRGTGETSIIDGNVDISIPGSQKLTSPVMEALAVSGTVTVKSEVNDMIIRKCKITNMSFEGYVDGAVIDRCYLTSTLTLSSFIKGMTVVNTKLFSVNANNGTNNTTLVNCNINSLNSNFSGTIINSIIDSGYLSSTVVLNTLYYSGVSIYSNSVTQNCYSINISNLIGNDCECYYSTTDLQSNGYLGTDGTVVGINGGDTPFTLIPSVPKVTSSDIRVDKENKKLNVKLTVSPQ